MSSTRLLRELVPAPLRSRLKDTFLTYHRALEQSLVGSCQSVLDVGCGWDSPLQVFSSRIPLTVGVDGFAPSLERSRQRGIHTRYEQLELLEIGQRFAPGSFDGVVALDVIEHFEKPDGWRLLEAMERIARKRVIVFTPNGFLPQGEHEDNPWQVHRSGWTAEDFLPRGYRVLGLNGWKGLRGERAEVRLGRLGARLSQLSQPLVTYQPRLAFQLLAVRELG
jgi:hypothetical protein